MGNLEQLFEFFQFIEKLKNITRYSAQDKKYQESTAEHSWKLILMIYATAKEMNLDLDLFHSIKLAIVHDLPEILAGDTDNTLVFNGKINISEKENQEEIAMRKISTMVSKELGEELFNLWKEYQMGETKESRFVKAMDKLEASSHKLYVQGVDPTILHLVQYSDFAVSNFGELKPLLKIFKEKMKKRVLDQGLEWKGEYEKVLKD